MGTLIRLCEGILPQIAHVVVAEEVPDLEKIERNIDGLLDKRVEERERCTACIEHDDLGYCDCPFRFSNLPYTLNRYGSRDGLGSQNGGGAKAKTPAKRTGRRTAEASADGAQRERDAPNNGDVMDANSRGPAEEVDVGEVSESAREGPDGEEELTPDRKRNGASAPTPDYDTWTVPRKKSFRAGDVVKVQILIWEGNNVCWVRLDENSSLYERMNEFLNLNQDKYAIEESPDINKLHLVEYKGCWYRSKITGRGKAKIRCIDTGVQFSSENVVFKELDRRFERMEDLAFKVYVSDDSMLQEPVLGLTEMRITGMRERGIYEIKIVGDIQPLGGGETVSIKSIQLPKSTRRNVIDDLMVGMRGLFVAMDVRDKIMVGCLVPDELQDAVVSYRHVRSLWCLKGEGTRAEVGHFVLAPGKKYVGWRGIVKSKAPSYGYELDLVDMGFSYFAKKVYKMPERAADLLDLGVRIKIKTTSPNSFPLVSDNNYYFEIRKKLYGKKWSCVLKDNYESEEYPVEAVIEQVHNYSHKITYVPFDSGCHVRISAMSQTDMEMRVYVRRMDEDYYERFLNMCDSVQQIPENSNRCYKSFWDNLGPGQLVAAKYKDNMCYRALVLSRNNDNVHVLYLDYGNEQTAKLKNLKPLPDYLIKEPVYATRVSLLTKKNSDMCTLLYNLMRENRDLVLHYSEEITNGVFLIDKVTYQLHRQIFQTLAPKPSRYIDKFTRDFFGDAVFSVGTVKNFVILFVDKDEFMESGTFWAANPNHCALVPELEDIGKQISDYCRGNASPYSPRNGELCFAHFQDNWYRGFATDSRGKDFQVFFMDYGNSASIRSGSIRKMKREYFTYPPLAMKCILEGFDGLKKSEVAAGYNFLRERVGGFPIRSAEIVKVTDMGSFVFIREMYGEFPGC